METQMLCRNAWLAGTVLTFALAGCGKPDAQSEYQPFSQVEKSQADSLDARSTAVKTPDQSPATVAGPPQTADTAKTTETRRTDRSKTPAAETAAPVPGGKGIDSKIQQTAAKTPAVSSPREIPEKTAPKPLNPASVPGPAAVSKSANPGTGRKTEVAVNTPATPGGAKPTAPRKVQLLVPQKEFRAEGPEMALRVSYDDIDLLKILNMEPVTPDAPSLMPVWLKNLDGKRIRIRGFMYPAFESTGLTRFGLARDNQICCFGKDPKIYDLFPVKMREGKTTDYIQNRPFDVVGVFRIRPYDEEGKLLQLYRIDDAIVIEK